MPRAGSAAMKRACDASARSSSRFGWAGAPTTSPSGRFSLRGSFPMRARAARIVQRAMPTHDDSRNGCEMMLARSKSSARAVAAGEACRHWSFMPPTTKSRRQREPRARRRFRTRSSYSSSRAITCCSSMSPHGLASKRSCSNSPVARVAGNRFHVKLNMTDRERDVLGGSRPAEERRDRRVLHLSDKTVRNIVSRISRAEAVTHAGDRPRARSWLLGELSG